MPKASTKKRTTDPFRTAARKADRQEKKPSAKGTTLAIPEDAPRKFHEAVGVLIKAAAQLKAAGDQKATAKEVLQPLVEELLCQVWCEVGKLPERPVSVQNDQGQRITLVLSDKTRGAALSQEQIEQLRKLTGGRIDSWLEEQEEYQFDSTTLAEPGVREKVQKALARSGLSKAQLERLLVCRRRTCLKRSIINELPRLVDGDPGRLQEALEVLGSAVGRYLK